MSASVARLGCNWRDPVTDELCAIPPTRAVTSGCRHEHVATFAYCAEHAVEFAAGTVGCWPCWKSVGADVGRVLLANRPLASRSASADPGASS